MKLGDKAPNFDAETSEGKMNFYDYLGDSWGILFSHPADFTPVCTTELGAAAKYKEEFDKLNVKVVALSVDGLESHKDWIHDINETQKTTVNFPIIADEDKKVSRLYDMIHPEEDDTQTVRSVYVIDPEKTIKLMITYPASTGRNFKELLRVIKSLQLTRKFKVSTPADWEEGDDVVISTSVSNEEAKSMFPKGYKEVKPYLKLTPQPD
ncbi:peroxiredoxin [Salinimicrobium catena]|uniref:Peroxiredoxin n=1 Tax=Salinimicrobium catena TaxID=390640 RepID=A0A1H5PAB6_9FLAO|nr:peroxiredoxin [Salinimicrobium catena]SDL76712.1 peroxiredoxin [Salinimicrobium catena]SEF10849.1 peroxiredoxin [Salinimicrobium catena]